MRSAIKLAFLKPHRVPNRIMNPGFELLGTGSPDTFTGWTESGTGAIVDGGPTNVMSGTHSCKITAPVDVGTRVYQNVTQMVPGTVMFLTFWTRGDGVDDGNYQIEDITNSAPITAREHTTMTSTSWGLMVVPITIPAGCTEIRVSLYCPSSGSAFAIFDHLQLTT